MLADADLDQAVEWAMAGKMFNSGQCCAAAKRFILHRKISDEFTERLRGRMQPLQPGDPMLSETGYAPLVGTAQANELSEQVQQSVALGAKVVLGGDRPALPGAFFNPTILTNIQPGMPAYEKELFGPVANLFTVENEDEAVAVANSTEFGLGSVICSRDTEKAERLARKLEAGMVYLNTYTISEAELPFGGIKNSGFGRELGGFGIQEFLNKKLLRRL